MFFDAIFKDLQDRKITAFAPLMDVANGVLSKRQ